MARATTLFVMIFVAGLFGWGVSLPRLFSAFQPITVALSIMIAAIFVRLNRGMPTLEWKSLAPEQRANLTLKIVELAREYARIIAVDTIALIGLLALSVVGKDSSALWPIWTQRAVSAAVGGIGTVCLARMAYVVWRDVDMVTLQKRLIDGLASRDLADEQGKIAGDKLVNIRSAGIRKIDVAAPKAWDQ